MNSVVFSEPEPITIKSPATISEQLEKLKTRGLIIEDEKFAHDTLETINYYRLVHYFSVFLDESSQYYKKGTRFEDALRLYDFDKRLRTEIHLALEDIEVAVRAAVSNYHAHKYGAAGYLNTDSFDRRHNHKSFMNKIERMVDKNSDLSFVRHHNDKYGGKLPLWVMMEMFSFGMLVFFYQDMKIHDRKEIAKYYFNLDSRHVENWLEKLSSMRNHCAHYNRIYGKSMHEELRQMTLLDSPREYEMGSSLFDYLLVMKLLLHRRGKAWGERFAGFTEDLFRDYADIVKPEVLGFPVDWKDFFN